MGQRVQKQIILYEVQGLSRIYKYMHSWLNIVVGDQKQRFEKAPRNGRQDMHTTLKIYI